MKLLIICQYFYPESFRVSDVSFKLAEMGYDVTVLTGLPNYPAGEIYDGYNWDTFVGLSFDNKLNIFCELINGVRIIRCKIRPRKSGKLNLFLNYFSYMIQASKVARRMCNLTDYDFDKIIVFQYSPVTMVVPAIILKRKLRKPLFVYCFDLWPESIVSAGLSTHGFIYQIVSAVSRYIYSQADLLLTSSRSFKKYFNEKLKINVPIKFLPIYAEELFTQRIQPIQNHIKQVNDGIVNLVFAGNVGEMQSIETIIKAAEILKGNGDIRFHIIGDGSALNKSIKLAKDLGLENIVFHGRHPVEEMPEFYSMADAFLVTLKREPYISYTLPGKIQSYMAYGKPIIAAINGETYDLIQSAGCGLCCPAEDYEGLAEKIQLFYNNRNDRQWYGERSKSYYDANFSERFFYNSFLKILEN